MHSTFTVYLEIRLVIFIGIHFKNVPLLVFFLQNSCVIIIL